jgi:hypothetical protein
VRKAHFSRLKVSAAIVLAALVLTTACTAEEQPGYPAVSLEEQQAEPVTVSRRDLVSVVVLDAKVVASAEYRLVSPAAGAVNFTLAAGKPVGSGQQLGTVGGVAIPAPREGSVIDWLVPQGANVAVGVPVVALRLPGYGLVAQVPQANAYRVLSGQISARGQITDGPGPFDCQLLPGTPPPGQGVAAICVIPADVKVFDGLTGLLALKTAEKPKVLAIPVAAVTATSGRGEVWKLVDGKPTRRQVEVGISDGINVEIVSGLAEGDQVLPYSPAFRRPQS